jgi:hypothetical protein
MGQAIPARRVEEHGRSRIALAGVAVAALVSLFGLSQLVVALGNDPRPERRELLLEAAGEAPAKGLRPFVAATGGGPRYAGSAVSLMVQSVTKRTDLKFFEGMNEYRIQWHQLDGVSEARSAYDAALARDGWVRVSLPNEIAGGFFYEDGVCITQGRTRWQCLHREGDTLIVGEALTIAARDETPFGPHHALQTGTKRWISVREQHAGSRLNAKLGAGLLIILPWGAVGIARAWRRWR